MRHLEIWAIALVLAAPPALGRGQEIGLTGPEVRLPAALDRRLREEFQTDEDALIDGLRQSAEEIGRPGDCGSDAAQQGRGETGAGCGDPDGQQP